MIVNDSKSFDGLDVVNLVPKILPGQQLPDARQRFLSGVREPERIELSWQRKGRMFFVRFLTCT